MTVSSVIQIVYLCEIILSICVQAPYAFKHSKNDSYNRMSCPASSGVAHQLCCRCIPQPLLGNIIAEQEARLIIVWRAWTMNLGLCMQHISA